MTEGLPTFTLVGVTTAITAIGALGTAAYLLVDTSKLLPWLVPSSGFQFIREMVVRFAPSGGDTIPSGSALSAPAITDSLYANWLNDSMSYADQKSAAKTLLKLRVNAETAPHLAALTGVNTAVLTSVAVKLATGDAMTQPEMDAYGRFDLLLSIAIDRGYQLAEQRYRTTAQAAACAVAVLLAELAAGCLGVLNAGTKIDWNTVGLVFLVGLLATPLAPLAKNLVSAVNSAAAAVQSVKK